MDPCTLNPDSTALRVYFVQSSIKLHADTPEPTAKFTDLVVHVSLPFVN